MEGMPPMSLSEDEMGVKLIIIIIHHHHHHHLFLKRLFLPSSVRVDVFPDMRSLHKSLNTTHSWCKPSSSISSRTQSFQIFLPLPAHLTPATTTFLQAGHPIISTLTLHMPKPPQSTTPHHLSHTLNPQKIYKSTLYKSFSDTPHIHLTIIRIIIRIRL